MFAGIHCLKVEILMQMIRIIRLSFGLKQILQILVLVKDLGTRIVKLVLECSLRSHDPAHMMHLPSGSDTMKAIEFDWHNILSGTLTSVH